jgi:hypothetical protein
VGPVRPRSSGASGGTPRGYRVSGTWLDESHALLDVASPLDRLDPGPIERVTLGRLDVEALSALSESLRGVFGMMHAAIEQLGAAWQHEIVPALVGMSEQLAKMDARADGRKVDAARRRRQGKAATTRGRPSDYPTPRR